MSRRLLGLGEAERTALASRAPGRRSLTQRPGWFASSLGAYNTTEDIDTLVEMLERITRGAYQGVYRPVVGSGDYKPAGLEETVPAVLASVGA